MRLTASNPGTPSKISLYSSGRKVLPFFLLMLFSDRPVWAQAAVESAGATSTSAAAAVQAKRVVIVPAVPATDKNASAHLAAQAGLPPDVVNRRALEQRAGQDAGKLLLRSHPAVARVWVDGAFVGSTPMLLILPPGKFKVELRGPRSEYAVRAVDLLPRETREIALTLAIRYPTRATVH
jgi:hypothetical protein